MGTPGFPTPGTVPLSLSLGLSSSRLLAHPQYLWNTALASTNAQLIKLTVISISFCKLTLHAFVFIAHLQAHTRALDSRTTRAALQRSSHQTGDGLAASLLLSLSSLNALH